MREEQTGTLISQEAERIGSRVLELREVAKKDTEFCKTISSGTSSHQNLPRGRSLGPHLKKYGEGQAGNEGRIIAHSFQKVRAAGLRVVRP